MQWNRGEEPVEGQNCLVRLGKWKLVNYVNAGSLEEPPRWEPEVFDLNRDPYEQADYSSVAPKQLAQLSAIYQLWLMDMREDLSNRSLSRTPIQIGGSGAERVVLTRQDWTRSQGGGWGKNGSWKVLFTEDAEESEAWKVRVLFPRGVTPKHVKLGINSGSWTYITYDGEIKEGVREVTIEGVDMGWLPGQAATVDCRLIGVDGDEEVGPHQLIFFR
jgi:hypothetical protein